MPVIVKRGELTPSQLFKRTRRALGFSPAEMQDALCLMDLSTLLKIERGAIDVHGPTWVALWNLLENQLLTDGNAPEYEGQLIGYQRQVEEYMKAIRLAAADRRQAIDQRRNERNEETYDITEDKED